MKKMYRIYYSVDQNGAICHINTYPLLDEKNTYYIIQTDMYKKHIKKVTLGKIENVDIHRTTFAAFVIDLSKKDEIIQEMMNKVKENALQKVKKFQQIYDNAVPCKCKVVDVKPE